MRARQSYHMGVFNQISQKKMHEGGGSLVIRSDGGRDKSKPKAMSGEYSINKVDIKDMTTFCLLTIFRDVIFPCKKGG